MAQRYTFRFKTLVVRMEKQSILMLEAMSGGHCEG
jgi:hypothetical protein